MRCEGIYECVCVRCECVRYEYVRCEGIYECVCVCEGV